MVIKNVFLFAFCICLMNACKKEVYDSSIEGFQKVEKDLIDIFGEHSYYTDLSILHNKKNELEVNLLVTDNPRSFTMEGWNYKHGEWKKISDVSLELAKGNIENYMYDINSEVNIVKIGYLVNLCIKRAKENQYISPVLDCVSVISPYDGDKSKMAYEICLITANNEKFTYYYSLKGDLINKDKSI